MHEFISEGFAFVISEIESLYLKAVLFTENK